MRIAQRGKHCAVSQAVGQRIISVGALTSGADFHSSSLVAAFPTCSLRVWDAKLVKDAEDQMVNVCFDGVRAMIQPVWRAGCAPCWPPQHVFAGIDYTDIARDYDDLRPSFSVNRGAVDEIRAAPLRCADVPIGRER